MSNEARTIRLAVSAGCPCGIGPEVSWAAAAALASDDVSIDLFGDAGALEDARTSMHVAVLPNVRVHASSDLAQAQRVPGKPGPEAGAAQLRAVDEALDCVRSGHADALVTGPVSKYAIASSGVAFVGHTEHLQERTGAPSVVMLFAGPRLRTSLVTTHLAIANVPSALDVDRVRTTIVLTGRAMREFFGLATPRIAVVGLNPHAGEEGMFGDEEPRIIAPAVGKAASDLGDDARVVGPIAAEAAFRQVRDGAWDVVVAMYHDQATIASKLLDFGDAVNVTLGLPIVRTSVDHGTAYDIAGRGLADPSGMIAAMRLAAQMVRSRGRR